MSYRILLLTLLLALLATGCSTAPTVETVQPRRGNLEDSFTEEAVIRLARTFPVLTPAAGRLGRITLEPGDRVGRGQTLVSFDRLPAELDRREAAEIVAERQDRLASARTTEVEEAAGRQARAELQSAREVLASWEARREQARVRGRQAEVDLARSQTLFAQDAIPHQKLEVDEVAARTARHLMAELEAQVRTQRANIESARQQLAVEEARLRRRDLESQSLHSELDQARTRQARALHEVGQQVVRSPLDGVVLERYEQGPGYYPAGVKLLLLGDPRDLEARAEVLTEDALRLRPGQPVRLEPAPGLPSLEGKVMRIEPAGFTKLSSLGVEQRRVNVIIRLISAAPRLGAGYRLRARFVVGQRRNALLVPRYAVLQKPDRSYYVFLLAEGRLRERPVELGLKGDLELEVVKGLSERDLLVALPETTMRDGDRAAARPPVQ